MPVTPIRALALATALLAGSAIAAHAQSAASSGAQEAETQSPATAAPSTPAGASAATVSKRARRRTTASPTMRMSASPEATGPYTSTVQPDTSDLSGSNGGSITQSMGSAPPGVAPPNGSAPDTGGGAAVDNVPNTEGGPH